jgi:hypothetical protein
MNHTTNGRHEANRTNGHASGRRLPIADPAPPTVTTVSDGAPQAPAEGRDAGGKFAKGNRHGRGNPFSRRLAAMRQAFLDAVAPEEVGQLARQLLDRALHGHMDAAALFLAYALGKPSPVVNPDTLDINEWTILAAAPGAIEVAAATTNTVAPDQAVGILRLILDARAAEGDGLKVLIDLLKGAIRTGDDDDLRHARQRLAAGRARAE